MAGKNKVTDSMFKAAKIMFKGGANQTEVAEFMKVSRWTAGMIDRSEDYDEYRNNVSAFWIAQKKRKEENKAPKPEEPKNENPTKGEDLKLPGGTLSNAYMMNRIIHLLEDQNKNLELISNKLAFIVEQLS